ncbi:hypothetical protein [Dongshaea marina]|uniref:hypothetical protein n=1 Tax=Dongshaea marina TaxID=2047966 RepID=UPI001900DE37|nr:hypothetical protein [Dongshaea marina]
MKTVRDRYGVPAYRGAKVLYEGKPGVIRSARQYLRISLDEAERVVFRVHPRDEFLTYLDSKEK